MSRKDWLRLVEEYMIAILPIVLVVGIQWYTMDPLVTYTMFSR